MPQPVAVDGIFSAKTMDLSSLTEFLGEKTTIALAGLIIGLLFGICAQRSRFCLRSAVVEFWNRQGTAKLAIWLFAFSSAIVATQLFITQGWLDVSQARQLSAAGSLSGALVGGLLFGILGDRYGRKPVLVATLLMIGIGTTAIQLGAAFGARVFATAGNAEKVTVCEMLGAVKAFDYQREDFVEGIKAATTGADVILDIMGAKYLDANVRALARGGRLVVIGLQGGVKGELNLGTLLSKGATVTATSLRFRPVAEKSRIVARVAELVWPLVASGAIRVARETRFAIGDVRAAHEQLTGGDNVGKIVLTF